MYSFIPGIFLSILLPDLLIVLHIVVNIRTVIHSTIDEHLGSFYFIAIINNAAMNILIYLLVNICHVYVHLGISRILKKPGPILI